jgi:WD40 repeat protein
VGRAARRSASARAPHRNVVDAAEFSADGARVVTAAFDHTAAWDACTGRPLTPPLRHDDWIYTPSSTATAGVSNGQPRSYGTGLGYANGQRAPPMSHSEPTTGPGSVPTVNGSRRLVGTPLRGSGTQNRPARRAASIHKGGVQRVEFSPDGRALLTASWDHSACVWDVQTGRKTAVRFEGIARAAHFSPDGRHFVTASTAAQVWDAASGAPATPVLTHRGVVLEARFSADGRLVVTASPDRSWPGVGRRHRAPRGRPVAGQRPDARCSCSPDGTRVATACANGNVRVWENAHGPAAFGAARTRAR